MRLILEALGVSIAQTRKPAALFQWVYYKGLNRFGGR
jgi:hypothetical protein